jgi:uncharacterized membrane protein YsdA (DUF1294 family)
MGAMSIEILLTAIITLLILNLVALLLFRRDKNRARNGEWRTSESRLLLVSFFGPFGAAYAMRRYRHKTRKLKFLLVPMFMLMQVAILIYLLYILYF